MFGFLQDFGYQGYGDGQSLSVYDEHLELNAFAYFSDEDSALTTERAPRKIPSTTAESPKNTHELQSFQSNNCISLPELEFSNICDDDQYTLESWLNDEGFPGCSRGLQDSSRTPSDIQLNTATSNIKYSNEQQRSQSIIESGDPCWNPIKSPKFADFPQCLIPLQSPKSSTLFSSDLPFFSDSISSRSSILINNNVKNDQAEKTDNDHNGQDYWEEVIASGYLGKHWAQETVKPPKKKARSSQQVKKSKSAPRQKNSQSLLFPPVFQSSSLDIFSNITTGFVSSMPRFPNVINRAPAHSRYNTGVACSTCARMKLACDQNRPCGRCIKNHRADSCVDRSSRRGQKKNQNQSQS